MRTPKRLLLSGIVFSFTSFLFSLSTSPVTRIEAHTDDPDWLEEVYARFDSLRTDPRDWPTNASKILSSGFAEFRGTHFHAGIDISTNGRKGHRVLASRSGSVSRIVVSPYGYGKMLQVRHPDGFLTTYAHLQRFNDTIDSYVKSLQKKNGLYSLDISLSEEVFPIGKGELIAYTGDTGTGPPHLHFEIRDERKNPVNPLLFPAFADDITDSYPPAFHSLSFTPMDYRSTVGTNARPLILEVGLKRGSAYSVSTIAHMSGLIGVSAKVSDRVNSTAHRNAPYFLELFLDSIPLFSSRLHRFPASESEQIALHFDWPLIHSGEGRFQKLYVEAGNRLPLYDRQPEGAGILKTGEWRDGQHEILIVAKDIMGNSSTLRATVVFDQLPSFDIKQLDTKLILVPSDRSELELVTIGVKGPEGKRWSLKSLPVSQLASSDEGLVLPVDPATSGILKISAKNLNGTPSYPTYLASSATRGSNTSLAIKKEFLRDFLYVSVSSHLPFTLRPSLWAIHTLGKQLIDLNALDERTYFGTLPLSSVGGGLVRLEARGDVNGTEVESFVEFSVYPISTEGATIVAGDGEFTIEFVPEGVYSTLYCRVEKTEQGYSVHPKDILLKKGAIIRYSIPATVSTSKAGLFFEDESDFRLLSSPDPDQRDELTGRVTRLLGDFSVLPDSIPPSISRPSIRYSRGNLQVVFGLRDNRSGIHPDGIRILLDNELLIGEYDPEKKRVIFEEERILSPGSHELRVEAGDRMGNAATATRLFFVGTR